MSKCNSIVSFDGCEGEATPGVVSCRACFAEYCRRSSALDRKRKEDNQRLIEILRPMAEANWEDKPKIRILFKGFFSHTAEGKVRAYNGGWLLMKQKNSRRGAVITYDITLGDAVRVEILDKKGVGRYLWETDTCVATNSDKAKELADYYEREEVNA